MGAAYRCEDCAEAPSRCPACRARRSAALAAGRAARREQGTCVLCSRPALPGQTRCEHHRGQNARNSAAAHLRRRTAAA